MKVKRMPGLLCRSEASTAVCIPTTTRAVVLPRRSCRTSIHLNHPLRYSRLLEELDLPNKGEKRLHGPPNVTSLTTTSKREKTQKAVSLKKPPASTPSAPLPPSADRDLFQVVVMRVSIHCQGCAGKVKRHISKMEGVTSFSIDLESKRVTVMGHISPLSVLESISKVKKAEFWYS